MGTVKNADRGMFEQAVQGNGLVLVDFWAEWCMPCRMFGPVFVRVAEANPDATFLKVNTEEQQELAAALQITSIPTLMVFRDGYLLYAQPGALPEKGLKTLLQKVRELDMEKLKAEAAAQEAAENAAAANA